MPKHSLSFGIVALAAAALVLPGEAQANHENRYFGFGYQPFPYAYPPPPVIYEPPQGVREVAPGVFEYQVAPGRWRDGAVCCVVSGGNVDPALYAQILRGDL